MKWLDLPSFKSDQLKKTLDLDKKERDAGKIIFPHRDQIFRAFELTKLEDVKVVCIGQDPYYTPGVANGLAFSVNPECSLPPSLLNIFIELHEDIGILNKIGDLTPWAKQGVLLLNTSLTVEAYKPSSHKGRWDFLIDDVVEILSQRVPFILWGKHAQDIAFKHNVKYHVMSAHPSPMSANRGNFFGSKPFSKINTMLSQHIDWRT